MIEVNNLKKQFIKEEKNKKKVSFYAVDDISFKANYGEIVGVIGPNGAGKTTLLRMISGIMEPTSGEVLVNNKSYINNDIEIKKQIAFLSGNTKLYKDISAYEFLNMCGIYYGIDKKDIDLRIEKIANEFEIDSFLNQKMGNLSTGQNQRVGLARCALHDPKYYILDEATSGLDIILSQIVLDFIKKERDNGKCIIYSTHYMEEAENICDRVIIINKGKIIATGTPLDITKNTNTTNLRDAFFVLVGEKNE